MHSAYPKFYSVYINLIGLLYSDHVKSIGTSVAMSSASNSLFSVAEEDVGGSVLDYVSQAGFTTLLLTLSHLISSIVIDSK